MESKTILELADNVFEQVRAVRREIHRNPELAFNEYNTQAVVCSVLNSEGIAYRKIAGTGVLVRIDGNRPTDEVVVLRADMDGLQIAEQVDVEFAATNGCMHACGHDMHTASLLGAVILLDRMKHTFSGSVIALFQPGEEKNPGGASLILKEGHLDRVKPIVVIGQHVSPELPLGTFGIHPGQYMAATDELRISVLGKGGHGAMPHTTHDPIVASAAIVSALQTVVSRNADPIHPTLLTLGKIYSDGGGTNIIPEAVHLEGTLRTMNEPEREKAKERIEALVATIANAFLCEGSVNVSVGFPSVVNDPEKTAIVRKALTDLVSEGHLIEVPMRMTGEDFSFYTQRFPSVFFRTGVGRTDGKDASNLHAPTFFPNEEALRYGVAAMVATALRFLKLDSNE